MQQYFIKERIIDQKEIALDEEQSFHIQQVLRMKENSVIRIADPYQQVYYANVVFDKKRVKAVLGKKVEESSESMVRFICCMGLIKKEKWDYFIQKACECGVDVIHPFISSRCVVKAKDEKKERKLERWNKIAMEACEQAKRFKCAKVEDVSEFNQMLEIEADLKLIAYEDADTHAQLLSSILQSNPAVSSIAFMIGPEGGFSEAEVEMAKQAGFICVSLGKRILRAETAAVYTLACLSYQYER